MSCYPCILLPTSLAQPRAGYLIGVGTGRMQFKTPLAAGLAFARSSSRRTEMNLRWLWFSIFVLFAVQCSRSAPNSSVPDDAGVVPPPADMAGVARGRGPPPPARVV